MKPDEKELNSVISKYDGMDYYHEQRVICIKGEQPYTFNCGKCYTESLDSLVPVVVKLRKDVFDLSYSSIRFTLTASSKGWSVFVQQGTTRLTKVVNESPAMAMAIACYDVIKLLNKGESNES